jgi:phage baseplate assembly protein W
MTSEIYGRGLSLPLALDSSGWRESAATQKVEESIRIILGTQNGERVMRPTFGCNLKSLVFAPNNPSTANLARYYVEDGLTRWEPRIELVEVSVTNDNLHGRLAITITYKLRGTSDIRSLEYPLPLEGPQ